MKKPVSRDAAYAEAPFSFHIMKKQPPDGDCIFVAQKEGFLFCGKATAVATCRRQLGKSRLSNPTRDIKKRQTFRWNICLFLAQKEGFEPSRAFYTPTPLAGEAKS